MATTTLPIKLKPFDVPEQVYQDVEMRLGVTPPSFNLTQLSGQCISSMCDRFRKDVFKEAGLKDWLDIIDSNTKDK